MLAKQGQRILQNPGSLVAQVYKARYFPFNDMLNLKKGSNPSHAWRSIHKVIRNGTRQRVGNGRRIHIWEDKWLPTPTTYKAISPPNDLGEFPIVSSLIGKDTKWWKVNTIKALFLPFEASSILKIPLSYNLPKDKLIWVGNKRGYFMVKKAYYIYAKIVDSNEEGESSNRDSRSQLKKLIRQLKLPAKIRIFARWTCMNALPTMRNLKL